uniref:Regulatory protein zeste n=1 Tax=Timema cristinae TaxID=61476 RepID=A0A7R9CXY2_TIMCR|nr:unnamed protein product [Timema cristinae]
MDVYEDMDHILIIELSPFLVDVYKCLQQNTLTQKEKEKEWSEVLVKAQSLQLAGADKKWMFARDQLWGLWKCRALAKRDNAKKTGSGGGKDKVFDEVDQAIFEILKSNVVVLDGLGLPESQSEEIKITELVLEPETWSEPMRHNSLSSVRVKGGGYGGVNVASLQGDETTPPNPCTLSALVYQLGY